VQDPEAATDLPGQDETPEMLPIVGHRSSQQPTTVVSQVVNPAEEKPQSATSPSPKTELELNMSELQKKVIRQTQHRSDSAANSTPNSEPGQNKTSIPVSALHAATAMNGIQVRAVDKTQRSATKAQGPQSIMIQPVNTQIIAQQTIVQKISDQNFAPTSSTQQPSPAIATSAALESDTNSPTFDSRVAVDSQAAQNSSKSDIVLTTKPAVDLVTPTTDTRAQSLNGTSQVPSSMALKSDDPDLALHMARQISDQARLGRNDITIRLDPPDMGRIDVKLSINSEQELTAVIAASNNRSYAVLGRESHSLHQALVDQGYRLDPRAISLELRPGQDASQHFSNQNQGQNAHQNPSQQHLWQQSASQDGQKFSTSTMDGSTSDEGISETSDSLIAEEIPTEKSALRSYIPGQTSIDMIA